MQLDQGDRGFSFSKEGPLDMRMGPDTELTAEEIVNQYSELELGKIFREFGEEKQWRKIAKAIVDARRKAPIKKTTELAGIIAGVVGFRGKKRLHPATLIFQALRIAVNHELDAVQMGISKAVEFLAKGGRVGVLSFHSLEDRIVKHLFKAAAFRKKGDKDPAVLKLLTKKPVVPAWTEMKKNPRSRSAKLRFAEKL